MCMLLIGRHDPTHNEPDKHQPTNMRHHDEAAQYIDSHVLTTRHEENELYPYFVCKSLALFTRLSRAYVEIGTDEV